MSHSFDASLEEIIPTLCAGATLVLRNQDATTTVDSFFDEITRRRISVLNLPTSFWHKLVTHAGANTWPSSLRLLIIGGEKAVDEIYSQFRSQDTSHVRLLNSYGPTEATITSTIFDDRTEDNEAILPIGKPVDGVSHFVLAPSLRPLPRGEVGQLFIGGAGLATGYLGRPDLTEASFVPHPFKTGARIYATGDLVYRTESGNFIFVARNDNQVKVRGYRIEPAEIEAQIVSLPQVTEAAVTAEVRDSSEVFLVAHVAVIEDSTNEKQLREFLSAHVPAHLVPAEFRIHDSLPRTVSGKIDRRRLANPTKPEIRHAESKTPKGTHNSPFFEADVRKIWSSLLGESNSDDASDFFEAGGDSLRLLQLFSEIEHRTLQKPNPADFLLEPTLKHMIELVEEQRFFDATELSLNLNQGDSAVRPLFLAPGVCGTAVDYVHLTNSLDSSIPVFCLQIDRLDSATETALSVYARRCTYEIRRIQNQGPYAIAGYSAGSIIALEISRILLEEGELVDFLGVIDGVPPISVERRWPFSSPRRTYRFARAVIKRTVDWWGDPSRDLKWFIRRLKRTISSSYSSWTNSADVGEEISDLLDLAPGGVSDHIKSKWQRILDAVNAYRHQKVASEIILFRTAIDPVEGPYELDLSWGRVGLKGVTVIFVPGNHGEVLTQQTTPVLAKLMEPYLLSRELL